MYKQLYIAVINKLINTTLPPLWKSSFHIQFSSLHIYNRMKYRGFKNNTLWNNSVYLALVEIDHKGITYQSVTTRKNIFLVFWLNVFLEYPNKASSIFIALLHLDFIKRAG